MTPEEKALWRDIYAANRQGNRERREAGLRNTYGYASPDYNPPAGGLKRGPKPDLNRECTEKVLTARVTKREAAALKKHQNKLCRDSSPSTFYRFVLCQWLEAHRDKRRDPQPFSFDPAALDYRTNKRKFLERCRQDDLQAAKFSQLALQPTAEPPQRDNAAWAVGERSESSPTGAARRAA